MKAPFKTWWFDNVAPLLFVPFMFALTFWERLKDAGRWFKNNWAERISPTGE